MLISLLSDSPIFRGNQTLIKVLFALESLLVILSLIVFGDSGIIYIIVLLLLSIFLMQGIDYFSLLFIITMIITHHSDHWIGTGATLRERTIIFALLLFMYLYYRWSQKSSPNFGPPREYWMVLIFTVIFTIYGFIAGNNTNWIRQDLFGSIYLLSYFPLSVLFRYRGNIVKTCVVILLTTTVMALLAIVNYFVTLGRVVSNSEIFFPIIIVTVLSLFLIGNLNLRNRIILSVIIIINLFAVFVSLTRSMWIGLLGGILVLMLFAVTLGKISLKGNNIAKYILSGSVLIGVVAVLLRFNSFLYNVVKTRFGMIIMGGYDWSVLYRLIEIKKVMEYIPNHFLFGGGMGATIVTPLNITTHARISEGTPYIHNTFFYWLLKFGILGSLLWYLLWIAIIVKMVRLMKNQKDTLIQGLQLGSIVSILLLAIYSLASPHLSDNNGQFFLGLALALFYPHKIKYKTGI